MTVPAHYVAESHVSGDEIFNLLVALDPILAPLPKQNVVIACLSIALLRQEPDLTIKELEAGVRGASEWLCVFLSTTEAAKAVRGHIAEVIN